MKEEELSLLTYRGNSVSYIYDKMSCYRDQARTMASMLKIIGIDYASLGTDNKERDQNGFIKAENIAELLRKRRKKTESEG